MLVFGDSCPGEDERRLSVFYLARSVDQILAAVQLGRHVIDGPHVAEESAAVGVNPAQYDICLTLRK